MGSQILFFWRTSSSPPVEQSLKLALVESLKAEPSIGALLGANIYPVMIPQTSTMPALSYQYTASQRQSHLLGPCGLQTITVRFEVESFDHQDVETVRDILRNRLQGWLMALEGITVYFVIFGTEADGYYDPVPGSDQGTHFKRFDFKFKVRENLPLNN